MVQLVALIKQREKKLHVWLLDINQCSSVLKKAFFSFCAQLKAALFDSGRKSPHFGDYMCLLSDSESHDLPQPAHSMDMFSSDKHFAVAFKYIFHFSSLHH